VGAETDPRAPSIVAKLLERNAKKGEGMAGEDGRMGRG
jgi:hypothetical protein